ncbi:MAG: hypothetical protein OEO21_01565 [Candidatus Krumholzibacteria bacterium]|nr:hypothetical protein [Candidatus Krumholzibacteria bacterium]
MRSPTATTRRPQPVVVLTLALAIQSWTSMATGSAAPAETPDRATATVPLEADGSPGEVFDLFLPTRRAVWDPDWEIEIISPDGASAVTEGGTFRRLADPHTTWQLLKLDRERYVIELAYEKPAVYVMHVRIECAEPSPGMTQVALTYTAEGKTESMRETLALQLEHQIQERAFGKEGWQVLLAHYLEHGTRFEPFQPVAIERTHTVDFDAAPAEVFRQLNPRDGNHWTAATPDYVFGSENEPARAMWRMRESWYVLADYDEQTLSMRTVLFIPEIECLIEEVRCERNGGGGTTMTVGWRVAGLSPEGNEAVQAFFDNHWSRRMSALEESYRARLCPRGE